MFEKKRNRPTHKRQAGMTLELDVMSVVMGGVLPFTARGGAEAGIRWTPVAPVPDLRADQGTQWPG